MLESSFEQRATREIKKQGGLCLKWVSPGQTGVPDRIVLFEGGKIGFLEFKKPGLKDGLSPRQKKVFSVLEGYGFVVRRVASMEELNEFLEALQVSGTS